MIKIVLISITIIFLIGILIYGNILMKNNGVDIDFKVREFFSKNSSKEFIHIMNIITKLANVETILIITIPILFYLISEGMKIKASTIIISVFLPVFGSQTLKILFRVKRPTISKKFNYIGYSFPSGHATVGMSYYLTLAIVLAGGFNIILITLSFLLALSIGLSRLVLGVHWFTDVSIGIGLGFLCGIWSIYFYTTGFYFKWLFG